MGDILATLPNFPALCKSLPDHVNGIPTYPDNGFAAVFAKWMVFRVQRREYAFVVFKVNNNLNSMEWMPSDSLGVFSDELIHLFVDARFRENRRFAIEQVMRFEIKTKKIVLFDGVEMTIRLRLSVNRLDIY